MYFKIHATTTMTASNHHDLRALWKTYGGPVSLVGTWKVKEPLTEAQIRRLPAGLRAKLG